MEDIQSWWEVPSIAYFCSLFRTAFNLLDFDIEELEEALLTDGTEESASSLLTELIVRLLNGCLGNNDISAFNYQMYLRRLFRRKCQETGRYNPFNTDIDFQFLPLRTKVEILYALCDFRLDADDVLDLFKNLEAESLRVEPLGWDVNHSAYWYFYGTRLYREDIIRKGKNKKKKVKESKKRGWFYGDDWLDDEETERVWQVVCFTEEDWSHLTEKFSKATSKVEKELYRSLSQNFLPEIPRLFQEKERLQRKRLLELAPRRTSSRVLQKIKQKEEENKPSDGDSKDPDSDKGRPDLARESRAKRRDILRTKSDSTDTSEGEEEEEEEDDEAERSTSEKEMPQKASKRPKGQDKKSKKSSATNKGEPPPEVPVKTGRKTNNSLACATGQILIPDAEEPVNSTRKKLKTSQIFSQTEEDIQTDMYKVLEQLTAHEDAWPFMDPVEEEYAPNYYAVIRRPMDLRKMEDRLDTGFYTDFSMFKADFKLIVNNCRLYNGQDNEYTMMVDNLQAAFDRLTEKYMHRLSSSDEEIAVEYQIPTPSRKHKLKPADSPTNHKKKKRKSHSETGEEKASPERAKEERNVESTSKEVKESHHKSKDGKQKKQRKSHHRHGKHSKNHKKEHHKSVRGSKNSKHSKKQRHGKGKDGKKSKQKRKKNKHTHDAQDEDQRAASPESAESSHCSRSASPLPSIHTPTPSPSPPPSPPPSPLPSPEPEPELDFYKDKYDKIKERRRGSAPRSSPARARARSPHAAHAPHAPHAWDALFDCKQKTHDKHKQNLPFPEKDKNRKLRETIEKLKAKNEKYKDSSPFNNLFADRSTDCSTSKESSKEDRDDPDFTDDEIPETREKSTRGKKANKKMTSARNESASEALEQAVKDISKWLEDAPKGSGGSSPCDSPAPTVSTEEHDSRLDDELAGGPERSGTERVPLRAPRKRPASREPRPLKRREIQRTIDRLQPGKSKGNLLTNISSKHVDKVEEVVPSGPINKVRDSSKPEESSPKLSLGSVLPPVEFTLGKDHNFADDEPTTEDKKPAGDAAPETKEEKTEVPVEVKTADETVETKNEVTKPEVEEPAPKLSQEKATPNLSAWFKAFGAPKSTPTPIAPLKKKPDEVESQKKTTLEKEAPKEEKPISPKNAAKYDSPPSPATPNPDGDEPGAGPAATPRARRASTASSVSERSSFSQDLDSPRHQLAHSSPLLRSPASPRTDDFQKITYPIINGTVRAGFYQDTTSMKSSPEKSCSPREGPQSPYSPYSQHVYASNNSLSGSATPNYMPTYGQHQPPPYYDAARAPPATAPVPAPATARTRLHDDYTALGPDSYPPPLSDTKNTLFPVKKRTYNETETSLPPKILSEPKESTGLNQNRSDYQKMVATMQSMSGMPSVDDIAVALGDKSELGKHLGGLGGLRDKPPEYLERRLDARDHASYEPAPKDAHLDSNKPIGMTKNDNVDMVNMGYMNPDMDRRLNVEANDYSSTQRDMAKLNTQPKGYEIDAIAMNLGMGSSASKGPPKPAHSQERSAADLALNHHLLQQEYEALGAAQGSFSLNDIDLANKKLYADWKMSQRKLDHTAPYATTAVSGSATATSSAADKPRAAPHAHSHAHAQAHAHTHAHSHQHPHAHAHQDNNAINYNKNLQQHQQYNAYNVQRSNIQNLPSELRIPNPRGLLKNEHMSVASSLSSSEMIPKSVDTTAKSQKPEKHQTSVSHSASSLQYKTPYSSHSALPLDSLRNLPNIPQMLERYTNDDRYLSSFAGGASLYHDKSFQMAHMSQIFNMASEHPASTAASAYSQPSVTMSKDANIYKTSTNVHSSQAEPKTKSKRKRAAAVSQGYHAATGGDVLSGVKSSMVPGSAFNFGAAPNMPLYPDNSGFSIEDFRNSTNQLMAANYMAAVAHGRGQAAAAAAAGAAGDADKLAKPAHQGGGGGGSGGSGAFGFMGAGARAAPQYGFPGDGSPLYQQYLQRHQEELLRQTGAQIMGLYPPPYPAAAAAALAARPPYDTINRPSWL